MARVQEMAGEGAAAGNGALQREMERLQARWGAVADELEEALQSMERIRNRIGQS